MNLQEFKTAIDAHLAGWEPAPVIRDNTSADTHGLVEFIRLTVLHGSGLVDETTGVYSVNGSTVLHPFILQFDVFTEVNSTTDRSDELCQAVLDHWQVRNLGNKDLNLLAGTIQRIGEDPPRYHRAVQISGTREERITNRED